MPIGRDEEGRSLLVGVVSRSLDMASSMTRQRAGFSWAQGSGGETRRGEGGREGGREGGEGEGGREGGRREGGREGGEERRGGREGGKFTLK